MTEPANPKDLLASILADLKDGDGDGDQAQAVRGNPLPSSAPKAIPPEGFPKSANGKRPARRSPGRPRKDRTPEQLAKEEASALVNSRDEDASEEDGIFTDGLPLDQMKAFIENSIKGTAKDRNGDVDSRILRLQKSANGQIASYLAEQERVAKVASAADRAAQKAAMAALVKEFEAEGHGQEAVDRVKRAAEMVFSDDPDSHSEDGTPREVVDITGNQPAQTAFLRDMQPGSVLAQGGWGCVAGHTRIDHPDGTRTAIAALFAVGQPFTVVTGMGPKVCLPPIKLPPAELFTVLFTNGSEITVHPDHKFYAPYGWKPLREMGVGDYISASHEKFARKHENPLYTGHAADVPLHVCQSMAINGLWRRDNETAEEWGPLGTKELALRSTMPHAKQYPYLFPHLAYRKIQSITSVGVQEYYDLNVPDVSHYSAEGVWNHNSGKSWSGARKFAFLHALNTESEGMIIAPTREDLVRDIVPKFIDFCNELNWTVTRKEQPLRLTVLGRQIHCMSAEEPRRIASFTVGHGWVDEGAKVKESKVDPLDDAPTQIRGRMRCKKAKLLQLVVTTTPEGIHTWVQRDWINEETRKPNHRFYLLETQGNTALHEEYTKDLLATIPADLVEQYLKGHAVDYVADRAHSTFGTENLSVMEFDPRIPLHIGLDFNVDPMSWVAAQEFGGGIHCVGEVFIEGGTTIDRALKVADEMGWGKGVRVIFHPDRSSKARSTTGDGEFVSLMKAAKGLGWKCEGTAFGHNPPVIARIGKLSRAILSADGNRNFFVNAKTCPRLTAELRTVGRRQDGDYDPGKAKDKGHILSAIGYAVFDMLPDKNIKAGLVPFKY
jgi:hypothetical protein